MDFDSVLREHADLKVKLVMFLNDSGRLDEKGVCKPHYCSLGAWIKQSKKQMGTLSEFEDLVKVHDRVHASAAQIVELIKQNKRYDAKLELAAEGPFDEMIFELSQTLRHLKRRLQKAG